MCVPPSGRHRLGLLPWSTVHGSRRGSASRGRAAPVPATSRRKSTKSIVPEYLALLFLRTAPPGGDQALALGCGAGDWRGPWEGELGGEGPASTGPPDLPVCSRDMTKRRNRRRGCSKLADGWRARSVTRANSECMVGRPAVQGRWGLARVPSR